MELNCGETSIYIDVTSSDKTTSKTYQILIQRAKIPWHITTIDISNISNYNCPVCLAIIHCPKSIAETKPKHVFCKSCIDELTRTTKQNPLNEQWLTGDWLVNEPGLEEMLLSLEVCCVFARYGCDEKQKLGELGYHMKQCQFRLCFVEKSEELTVNKILEEKMKVIKVALCSLHIARMAAGFIFWFFLQAGKFNHVRICKLGFAVRLKFWESLSNSICMWFKLVLCSQKVNYILSPAYIKQSKIIN